MARFCISTTNPEIPRVYVEGEVPRVGDFLEIEIYNSQKEDASPQWYLSLVVTAVNRRFEGVVATSKISPKVCKANAFEVTVCCKEVES